MPGRQHKRYKKRVEVDVWAEGREFRMFSSDISESGIFIRTNKGLPPGTALKLRLYLPDGSVALAKGWVKRTTKTKASAFKNGMGIKLIEADENFKRFFEAEFGEPFTSTPIRQIIPKPSPLPQESASENRPGPHHADPQNNSSTPEDFVIVRCVGCNVNNRVHRTKIALRPRCGKCGMVLRI